MSTNPESTEAAGTMTRGKYTLEMRCELPMRLLPDALTPALTAVKYAADQGESISAGLRQSAQAAEQGMKDTIPLVARKGRASYLGERSIGHLDPGAVSSAILLRALADAAAEG